MYKLIQWCGWSWMLDCWHVEVIRHKLTCKSLDDYTQITPAWDDLIEISIYLALNYLDKLGADDLEFRNNSIILAYLLQYIELAHAMKHGDIGHVEATFLHWALVFKSACKHKYATYLIKLMVDMRNIYLELLKQVIHMNWLVNPTGSKDGFCSVDWVVELMNLYTKVRNCQLSTAMRSLPLFSGNLWWKGFQPVLSIGCQKLTFDQDISKRAHQYLQELSPVAPKCIPCAHESPVYPGSTYPNASKALCP